MRTIKVEIQVPDDCWKCRGKQQDEFYCTIHDAYLKPAKKITPCQQCLAAEIKEGL